MQLRRRRAEAEGGSRRTSRLQAQGSAEHRVLLVLCWRSAGVLVPLWRSGVLVLAFCPLAFWSGVLPGPGVLGLAFWGPGVLLLAFWVPDFLDLGRAGVLAFWRSGFWRSAPLGVLLWRSAWRSGGWRSAGVLAFCWRSAWCSGAVLQRQRLGQRLGPRLRRRLGACFCDTMFLKAF